MTITSEDVNKYFQDLLAKHFELVKRAESADLARAAYKLDSAPQGSSNPYADLVVSLMADYGNRKHAEAIADELISRFQFPDGGGAVVEGSINGWGEAQNPDVDAFADQDPPESISVGVRVPDTERFSHLQR